ncbi:hypothetical protein [Cohnella panacarvi]|uniref:hypothetical protein n=1 Tax=Cohnella panacarvi TaxID=400776 RepID=UPI00047D9A11|nr:hypothetical protein [Cohnella panacarvi]
MNSVKPDWYRRARGRLENRLVFTDEMKQAVNGAIARGGRRSKVWHKWSAAAAALIVCVAVAIWALEGADADDAGVAGVQAVTPQEAVALAYVSLAPSETRYTEMKRMLKASVTVTASKRFEGIGTFYSYTTTPDDKLPHLAVSFETKLDSTPEDQFYDFGYGLLNQFSLENSTLFGEPHVRINGNGCIVPNCAYSVWVRFDGGSAATEFSTDIPGVESDFDGDGRSEFVETHRSKSSSVTLYKKFGSEIRSAEVYDPLGLTYPDSLVYDPLTHTFNAVTGDDIRSYRYSEQGDVLERVPTPQFEVQPELATDLNRDEYRYRTQPPHTDTLLFDRIRSLRMQVGGYDIYSQWHQTDTENFGLFLPNNATPVERSDGKVSYDLMKGKGSLTFRDDAPDVPLTYEDDLAVVLNYAGTAARESDSDSRTDYFLVEYDADHRVYVEIAYKLAELDKARPILLAMMANVKYAPK